MISKIKDTWQGFDRGEKRAAKLVAFIVFTILTVVSIGLLKPALGAALASYAVMAFLGGGLLLIAIIVIYMVWALLAEIMN